MKSIRSRLILWLVPSFLLLWLLGGIAVFVMFRKSEFGRVDEKLAAAARTLRLTLAAESADEPATSGRGLRRGRVRLSEFDDPSSGYYYQVWDTNGTPLVKSPSLGERSLPSRPKGVELPKYPRNMVLDGGEVVRVLYFQPGEGARGGSRRGKGFVPNHVAGVGISLEGVNHSLAELVTGMTIAGFTGAALATLWISLALRYGLRPLERLGREMEGITPGSLFKRFVSHGVPTEIAPVVRSVNGLLERLEDGFHRERRFSADLAHELRTPLAETRSLVELGLRFPDEINKTQQSEILAAGERMERMVESMMLLARCEGAGTAGAYTDVATRELIDECWQTRAVSAGKRRIRLRIEVAADLVLSGNADLWRHLIGNLLSNAADYSPEGSEVVVRSGPAFLLEIINPAPDLREADLRPMFDRLWRGDRARSGDDHCGLGLSIVMACAKALEVKLDVMLHSNSDLTMRIRAAR